MVRAGETIYAVPSIMVEQVIEYKAAAYEEMRAKGEIAWKEWHYPLRSLLPLLGTTDTAVPARQIPVLLLKSGTQRAAIRIDEIIGNREVVVKTIGPQLSRLAGIAGATVLGNGQVVLILNPVQLVYRGAPAVHVEQPGVAAAGPTPAPVIPATPAPAAPASEPRPNPLVMVVDDSLTVRKITSRMLAREGYEVAMAKDGVDALQQLQDVRPDCILLDVEMPRMDGWAVLHAVRNDPDLAGTPVIMTSVVAEQGLGQALGATDYFVKPIDWDRLKGLMERYRPEAPGEARILVVDDDPDARERLRRSLGREGWTVDEAENGRIALERISQARPSLILLDLMMPEMDGFGFLRALRARPDGDVPVVVLTAKEITTAEKESLNRQADRVIAKGSMSLAEIGRQLRLLYARSAMEPVPGQLQGLIDRLAEKDTRDRR
jgi:CheY-like chemotaxis protein